MNQHSIGCARLQNYVRIVNASWAALCIENRPFSASSAVKIAYMSHSRDVVVTLTVTSGTRTGPIDSQISRVSCKQVNYMQYSLFEMFLHINSLKIS